MAACCLDLAAAGDHQQALATAAAGLKLISLLRCGDAATITTFKALALTLRLVITAAGKAGATITQQVGSPSHKPLLRASNQTACWLRPRPCLKCPPCLLPSLATAQVVIELYESCARSQENLWVVPIYGNRFADATDAYLTAGFSSAQVSRQAGWVWRPRLSAPVASCRAIASAGR